jgi:Cys-tRNA(Pro) deacylase
MLFDHLEVAMDSPTSIVTEEARRQGFSVEVREFEAPTRTAEDAARAVGCDPAQIVKSLLFLVDGRPVMTLVSGPNRLDEKKLAARFQVGRKKIKQAPAEEVLRLTGFAVGGVPPFGHKSEIPVYIDADLLHHEVLWAAAGTPHSLFSLAPEALTRTTRGVIMDLKKDR